MFLEHFNGRVFLYHTPETCSTEINMYSDASKYGYGASYGKAWLQGTWPESWQKLNTSLLELYPIFLLVHMFAPKLARASLTFHCDNMAVVHILNRQTSKCPLIMSLVRPVVLQLLRYNIRFRACHIPGVNNTLCDVLSRSQDPKDTLHRYGMQPQPTGVPPHLLSGTFKLG